MSTSSIEPRSRLATARWAQPSDTARELQFNSGDIWLGLAVEENDTPIGYGDDRHVCLVSSTRGGKGTTAIVNNLCLWPGSCVVIDPKGENATVTAGRRGLGSKYAEGMGQNVFVLDPFRVATIDDNYRACFNPLDLVLPDNEESIDEASLIADAIVVQDSSSDPHWNEMARALIKGLILHVATSSEFEGMRNLVTVRSLLTRGDWVGLESIAAENERRLEAEEELLSPQDPFELLWFGMKENSAFQGIVAGVGQSFLSTPEKERGSILSTARRHTEFIDSPAMRRSLETSDFSLSDLKTDRGGVSVFLCLPSRYMTSYAGWLRMVISLTVVEMEKTPGRPACGYQTLMLLDEFAALKKLDVLEAAVAQLAGYGLKMFFVLQSLPQLKHIYKDNWETFIGNASLKIFFSVDDMFTRKYLSDFIGETEIMRETRSRGTTEGESESRTSGTTEGRTETRTSGRTESVSEGQTTTRTDGTTHNRSTARGSSSNSSMTENFSPGALFVSARYKKGSRSQGNSNSLTETQGSSESRSVASGTSETMTHAETVSDAIGSSHSVTVTDSIGTTHSVTDGRAESLHKGALITADEIGRLFSRVDSEDHPAYPGMALVLITGHDPIALRKSNYFEHRNFVGHFDPHPDHALPPLLIQTMRVCASGMGVISRDSNPDGILPMADSVLVKVGDSIRKGDPMLKVTWPLGGRAIRGDDAESLPLPSPVTGQVRVVAAKEGRPIEPDSLIAEIEFNARLAAEEANIDILSQFDPFDNPFQKLIADRLGKELREQDRRRKVSIAGGCLVVLLALIRSALRASSVSSWLGFVFSLAVFFALSGGYFYLLGLWSEKRLNAIEMSGKLRDRMSEIVLQDLLKTLQRKRLARKVILGVGCAATTLFLASVFLAEPNLLRWLGGVLVGSVFFGLVGGYFYFLGAWKGYRQTY